MFTFVRGQWHSYFSLQEVSPLLLSRQANLPSGGILYAGRHQESGGRVDLPPDIFEN